MYLVDEIIDEVKRQKNLTLFSADTERLVDQAGKSRSAKVVRCFFSLQPLTLEYERGQSLRYLF